ncbi:MAG: zinc-ribbon domain-containing protein [Clostridium sp.]|nr:zinc-ribbon domain-containing protein [Clostridium sp.]
MGLISKTVKVKWNSKNKKYYEELGYVYTNWKDEFEVKIEDLTNGSNVKVECVCDNCKKKKVLPYKKYNRYKKEELYFCNSCVKILFGAEKHRETRLKNGKNSFAQYLIEEYGDNALELYWDYDKNTVDPWSINKGSQKKIWIKCQEKDYHGSYEISCNNFVNGYRCPYCRNYKVHPNDSLGQYIIDNYGEEFLWKIWSNKNEISPFEVAPHSNKKYWWNCPEDKHEPFERSCDKSVMSEFRCPECIEERKESLIEEKTRLYLEELGYTVLTEHNCSIKPINPKTGHYLPFDNEVILENGKHLIIEVHGGQHYNVKYYKTKCKLSKEDAEKSLHQRKLYDRYKRIKCIQSGYEYLELPYTAFDKGSKKYKKIIDNKIKEILNKK